MTFPSAPRSARDQRRPRSRASADRSRPSSPAAAVPTVARPLSAVEANPGMAVVSSQFSGVERREKLCSFLGLGVKVAVALVAGVSLLRLSVAYQERMERHSELRAVLDIQAAKLEKARDRFDHLFSIGGEQALIRQQGQWIAPNRLRVVWTR